MSQDKQRTAEMQCESVGVFDQSSQLGRTVSRVNTSCRFEKLGLYLVKEAQRSKALNMFMWCQS